MNRVIVIARGADGGCWPIRNQCTIAYTPTNQALDGAYRTIRVTVSAPERITVRTRT